MRRLTSMAASMRSTVGRGAGEPGSMPARASWTSWFMRPSMPAYLIISPQPQARSRSGSVSSACGSISTALGCEKTPIRFLPAGRSTAVLPPTLESTIARSEVGICTQSMPRIQSAAARPARSPITPPPSAITAELRVSPIAAKASSARTSSAGVLDASPAGIT